MAWQYCRCGQGLDEPSTEEVLEQERECPVCDRKMDPVKTVNQLIAELVERVEELERRP